MQGLGLSLLCVGSPAAFGASMGAFRSSNIRWAAYLALVISSLEMLPWGLIVLDIVMLMTG